MRKTKMQIYQFIVKNKVSLYRFSGKSNANQEIAWSVSIHHIVSLSVLNV